MKFKSPPFNESLETSGLRFMITLHNCRVKPE